MTDLRKCCKENLHRNKVLFWLNYIQFFFFFFGVVNTFAMGQDKLQHKMFLKLERQIAVL